MLHKFKCGVLFPLFSFEPTRTAYSKMCARRVRYHHVPTIAKYVKHITLNMRPR